MLCLQPPHNKVFGFCHSSERTTLLPPGRLCSFGEPHPERQVRRSLRIHWVQVWPIAAFSVIYPSGASLGVGVCGGNPTNRSLWCQRVESNHWPSAYEADVLTNWTTRAYVFDASFVDRSPFGIALTLVQVPGVQLMGTILEKKKGKKIVGYQPHIFASYLYCFSEHLLVWSPVVLGWLAAHLYPLFTT